jgi:hypothetical protein
MSATANPTWNTKYGTRRVKQALPTLAEAVAAAKDMADDIKSQIEIAAALMGMTEDEVRPEVLKARAITLKPVQIVSSGRGGNAPRQVVVERVVSRRPMGAVRKFGS